MISTVGDPIIAFENSAMIVMISFKETESTVGVVEIETIGSMGIGVILKVTVLIAAIELPSKSEAFTIAVTVDNEVETVQGYNHNVGEDVGVIVTSDTIPVSVIVGEGVIGPENDAVIVTISLG